MARRHVYNTSQIFEDDLDEHWNRLHSEDQYLHFGRTGAMENGPIFHSGENRSVDQAHYASQWNATTRLNGYSSPNHMGNVPHYQPDASDPSLDSFHPSAAGNVFMVPENHVNHPSSSNYVVENNFFDLSMGNGRSPYKRKSPGIPPITERGSTSSRYYCAGSSSDISSSSEFRLEKSTLDAQHSHRESLMVPPTYRGNQLSVGGETSLRNVRSRSVLDLESDVFRTHVEASYSHDPSSSRPPIDHPGSIDHPIQNPSVPNLQEWNPIHVSGAPHVRTMVSSNLNHEGNHFFGNASGEMAAGYNHEHISSINYVLPENLNPTPSHTRGVRSRYTHRSGPNSRVLLGNRPMGYATPSDGGLQLMGESHSSRHPRPYGPVGWRNRDRSGASRLSSERYRLLSEEASTHARLTPEGLMMVDRSSLYGSRSLFDQHREMRLDVDNMSYEELLALGERIGSVNTGLSERQLPKCLTETVYCSSDQMQEEERCVICLEEYQHMDDVGTLKGCGHDYHVSCIKKWLLVKNMCPICKGSALPDKLKEK